MGALADSNPVTPAGSESRPDLEVVELPARKTGGRCAGCLEGYPSGDRDTGDPLSKLCKYLLAYALSGIA
jgi:hypothetical protein